MKFNKIPSVCATILWLYFNICGVQGEDPVSDYKLQRWRFRDQGMSFQLKPSAVGALSYQHKTKAGKHGLSFASLPLPSARVASIVKPQPAKVPDEVNRLVDKVSAASTPHRSHYPKVKPHKGGPPHYPPLNRKALYATGLIYLRDFRPGSPLF